MFSLVSIKIVSSFSIDINAKNHQSHESENIIYFEIFIDLRFWKLSKANGRIFTTKSSQYFISKIGQNVYKHSESLFKHSVSLFKHLVSLFKHLVSLHKPFSRLVKLSGIVIILIVVSAKAANSIVLSFELNGITTFKSFAQ